MPQTYFLFLNLVEAIEGLPALPLLDPVEERLFHMLASMWAAGDEVTVLQAMNCSAGASPSTVHRRLKTLRDKNLIAYSERAEDHRVKCIEPTPLAREYFAALSRCMDRAVRG
jgi:DNA-binding MarR family transcriptional regulator